VSERPLKVRLKTKKNRTVSQKRWLERQLNDPYVARARREGLRSRAAYKLIEIDDKYRLLKPGGRVVDLGAAPGGWSAVAASRVGAADGNGKVVMESILETKAATILEFFAGLRGTLWVTFEEGTWSVWLYDLLNPHVDKLVVCNPRKNALLKDGNKSDRIDARKLAELLRGNQLKPVYHGETGLWPDCLPRSVFYAASFRPCQGKTAHAREHRANSADAIGNRSRVGRH